MRRLYICSYDVRNACRLARALVLLKEYAGGGQYSVFECYLDDSERERLMGRMQQLMADEDHFFVIPLRQKAPMHTLGAAVMPMDEDFYLVS